ncbi:chromate transporter [Roseobacter sp. SK209-2-6]|uniref:chromate efflux transporter n=1 Tax=Roseobacter sp. SK209-2-6 TaxID=388739 RepID=UPI0000F3F736|nr:chromate efflux transporter [Roseobacter sp. SK209-2-6]EBA17654.1 chromate transporter [Roseobacter sp. SK209-2-6]
MTQVSWQEMLRVFGRIGLMSFGGPAAQIAVMHRELVEERPWLDEESFLRGLSFCMLLPGPEAMQLCTYTGWRLRGLLGGLLAGLLFVLPGAFVIATLVWLYVQFGTLPGVQAAFLGVKAAVVVIVLQALWRLSHKALKRGRDWLLALFGFVGLFLLGLPFPLVILSAGAIGLLWPDKASTQLNSQSSAPHRNPLPVVLLWSAIWLTPLVLLSLFGFEFLADIGWFFAKLAVVSFGGAYAVLAYISQTVVEQHGWITAGEMIDALGLAETTPGPLILVTQFVAMLSGLKAGGFPLFLAAGATALWATFAPCFLWIFAAAPYVERLAGLPRLGAALKAITATVTGVILNLMTWFMLHVLFQRVTDLSLGPLSFSWPEVSSLDLPAFSLVLLAPLLAWLLKGRMVWLLAAMSIVGFVLVPVLQGL